MGVVAEFARQRVFAADPPQAETAVWSESLRATTTVRATVHLALLAGPSSVVALGLPPPSARKSGTTSSRRAPVPLPYLAAPRFRQPRAGFCNFDDFDQLSFFLGSAGAHG
jgi:hypothetical protein